MAGVDPDDFELCYFRGYERQAFDNNDLDYLLKTTATNGCGFVQHFNFGERSVAGYYIDSINNKIYNTYDNWNYLAGKYAWNELSDIKCHY